MNWWRDFQLCPALACGPIRFIQPGGHFLAASLAGPSWPGGRSEPGARRPSELELGAPSSARSAASGRAANWRAGCWLLEASRRLALLIVGPAGWLASRRGSSPRPAVALGRVQLRHLPIVAALMGALSGRCENQLTGRQWWRVGPAKASGALGGRGWLAGWLAGARKQRPPC